MAAPWEGVSAEPAPGRGQLFLGSALVALSLFGLVLAVVGAEVLGAVPAAATAAVALTGLFASFYMLLSQPRSEGGRAKAIQAVLAAAPSPRVATALDGRVLGANAAFARMFEGEAVMLESRLGDHGGDREQLLALCARAAGGSPATATMALGGNGTTRSTVDISVTPLWGVSGALLWCIAAHQPGQGSAPDGAPTPGVSPPRWLVRAMDQAPLGLIATGPGGEITYVNDTVAGWLAIPPATLLGGQTLVDLGVNAEAACGGGQFRCAIKADGEGPTTLCFDEVVDVAALGGERAFLVMPAETTGVGEALERRTDPWFRHLYDDAPFGIALLEAEGRIVQTNRVFLAIVAGAPAAVHGQQLLDLISDRDTEVVAGLLGSTSAREGAPLAHEVRLRGPEERTVRLYIGRIGEGGAGGPERIAYLVDATEQKRLEEQFVQSQKLETVGQLAGGIAHDFNNLLTAMIGFCDLLLLRHAPGDQSFADIMQIKQNANRAANLVRQLLAFSRQQTLKPTTLNLTDVLAELSHLLRRLLGDNITLELIHDRDLGLVKVDHGQLEQVVINLSVNARDAMAGGGELTIRTSNVHFETPTPLRREKAPAGDYVLIEVADSGHGIEEGNLDKIFEPFFSTKEVGSGTGLGLSTVYGIIKQTGGFIVPESTVDRGTTFRIYLPRHEPEDAASPAEAIQAQPQDLTGTATVLLVEDEAPVRIFAARALSSKGYTVLEAESGEAALALLEDGERDIDVLVTDVVMPNMDGPTLVRTARERRPDIKAILISGYAEEVFRRTLGEDEPVRFLPKPFSLKELASMVKAVLEGDD